MKIVIYNNKPIAVDTGDGIDWVKVFKKVEKISDKKFNVSSWMGYGELNTSDKGLFDGLTVEEFIKSKNIKVWEWSEICSDFVERELTI